MTNQLMLTKLHEAGAVDGSILDLGAGSGYFSRMVVADRAARRVVKGGEMAACDIRSDAFNVDGVAFTRCDIDSGIPYQDSQFDAVVAIEVLEHSRMAYFVLKEISRVLKPGGLLGFSVPNVGHLSSRLSFFFSGHYQLYPTPSQYPEHAGSLSGHVAPFAFQYWHYGLRTAGFDDIRIHADRTKRGAAGASIVLWPALKFATRRLASRFQRNNPKVFNEVEKFLREANSWTALTSRSLVFTARKA